MHVLSYSSFLECVYYIVSFLLETSHFVEHYIFGVFFVLVQFQYLPNDWLERLLRGRLFVSRRLCPERPG